MFQVIAERYERNIIIAITILEKLTSTILDRLIHHCHLLVFTGKSYRLEHSSIKA
nr:ATP-binding protein [Kosmotoga sp.]